RRAGPRASCTCTTSCAPRSTSDRGFSFAPSHRYDSVVSNLHGTHMRRLASRILIVVGVFVLVVAGMLISRSRAVRIESVEPSPSKADLSIKEVQLEEESGGVRWQLKADQALVFEREGRTSLRKVDLKVDER